MGTYDDTSKFGLQSSERKQDQRQTLDNSNAGTRESPKRTRVIITSYRTRCLDRDNAYGGAKPLCDSLKYAGLIKDDSEKEIDYEVKQVKVAHRKDEKTTVDIEYA